MLRRAAAGALIAFLTLISSASAAPTVRIVGNHFVDGHGNAIRLLGVDGGPDLTDACVSPTWGNAYRAGGVWGGPVDNRAIAAMTRWKLNAVRISLNEDCWLGINPVRRASNTISGPERNAALGRSIARHYRSQVRSYVRRLHAHGLIAVLDLHWSAPGHTLAFDQFSMPDADHSPAFWRSVAKTFLHDHSVVFDAFNEPFVSDPETLSWNCWRNGCRLPNQCADCTSDNVPPGCTSCPVHGHPQGSYRAVGMQGVVRAIRSTGARTPIIIAGRLYANDLSQWWRYRPRDRLHQLGVSFHVYGGEPCSTLACWSRVVAPGLTRHVPVVIGEFGPRLYDSAGKQYTEPCDQSFDQGLMRWADAHAVSYLAWAWSYDNLAVDNAQRPNCTYDLLDQGWYAGIPRPGHGQAVHDHLLALSAAEGGGRVH